MSDLQQQWCSRVNGTFLHFSTLSWEKEKEKVQQNRSHSAPPGALGGSKKWACHHVSKNLGADFLGAPKSVKNPSLSRSDHSADGHDTDVADEHNRGNNQRMDQINQCPCCGEQSSVCACAEGFLPEAFLLKREFPGQSSSVEVQCSARAPAEEEDEEFTDVMPNCSEEATVMLCNIPCRVGRTHIANALESRGFADSYNFIHLPKGKSRRYRRNGNIGYTFINFTSKEFADKFARVFEDFQFDGMRSTKKCTVKLAHEQGVYAKALVEEEGAQRN